MGEFPTGYEELKATLQAASGLSRGALQIYAAMLAQLLAAAVLRRSLGNPVPWLCALALVVADEWLEHFAGRIDIRDVAAAMLVPTMLLFAVRFVPGLVQAKRSAVGEPRDRQA